MDELEASQALIAQKVRPRWKVTIENILDHWLLQTLLIYFVVFSLFSYDLRIGFFEKDADQVFLILNSTAFVLFALETILSSIVKENYFLKLVFWIDLIATLTVFGDVLPSRYCWMEDFRVNRDDPSLVDTYAAVQGDSRLVYWTGTGIMGDIAKAVRLLKILKLYKSANVSMNRDEHTEKQALKQQKLQEEKEKVKKQQNKLAKLDLKKHMSTNVKSESQVARKSLTNPNIDAMLDQMHFSDSDSLGSERNDNLQKVIKTTDDQTKIKDLAQPDINKLINEENQKQADFEESNVAKVLYQKTIFHVIILIFALVLTTPPLSMDAYTQVPNSYTFGLELLSQYEPNSYGFNLTMQQLILSSQEDDIVLVYLNVAGVKWNSTEVEIDNLRCEDLVIVQHKVPSEELNSEYTYVAAYNQHYILMFQSGLSILNTLMICFLLGAGTLAYNNMAGELVITPIENMMTKVKRIAENPIVAQQQEEQQQLEEEEKRQQIEREMIQANRKVAKVEKEDGPLLETTMLEQTLMKIGGLLALGFGEAGSQIIATNMQGGDDINPMVAGQKVFCIFGFCDIRNFTDATEVLQEGVMLFVNEIGEIVHGIVDKFSGAANKNIGDAFLLVWKFEDEDQLVDEETDDIQLAPTTRAQQLCDMSLISFLKIVAALKRSRQLMQYQLHPGLNERMPNYEVKMGFGLHIGWAIEGAIGSYYKIDASYLSPNVNMASRLEAATKQFGVPILISGQLYDFLTEDAKIECRQIDCVTVKGSVEPLRLYTCDVDANKLEPDDSNHYISKKKKKQKRVKSRINRDKNREIIFNNEFQIASLFKMDAELVAMRAPFKKEFYDLFQIGFDHYINGEWDASRHLLEKIPSVKGSDDLPSKNLIRIMQQNDFKAPKDWQGYRSLTEK